MTSVFTLIGILLVAALAIIGLIAVIWGLTILSDHIEEEK